MTNYFSKNNTISEYNPAQSKFLTPFQRKMLLKNLEVDLLPEYHRRLEIMLLADMGKSRTQICEMLGCSQEMARYWIAIAQAGLAHKWQERPIGRPKTVNDKYIERLKELVTHSPREYGYGFSCWTANWLSKHLALEFGIEISDRHINRLLKQMGLSTKPKNSSKQQVNPKDSGIKIRDLQSSCNPSFQWSFSVTGR
ncbi:helix-turn-helix domain-containing protein [Aetokthonos hydrillicola Thurmond2011]|uniref:Helix-turn-helix domain-containing protein n=1 Tax=Aetokthonos hydrillicola Thurmond2011 TaxID=2712845 RepID=A0AAP5M8P2_9CYAN|nr:helix-turn-helix domain-containing protein [Aetokthonos hydrillicola]MBW4588135.1 helix-turn-helix domain-containing protein [Aetokthonos hydrillicola CCALA 1050]MDR9893449.1 helix-turn-helix domain-containing protein [Aetokthonos hydrillicola Thurmond2011]